MRHAGSLQLAAALTLLLACTRPAAAVDHIKEGICPSLDIRNSVTSLQTKLRGCRVIEGHLSIVLMERFTAKNFENISFPELREITGYLKIYRLQGLRNLGDLFPNLAVVRGLSLFKDFAIIIYDNGNLQALGLRSLERVERGFVRIERNDRLCYINSIDWSRIVVDGVENNVIRKNYDARLCGLCPNAESASDDRRLSQVQCPSGGAQGRLLCWDERHCQKICPPECGDRSCTANGTCCHGACVGGCSGPTQHECHVCRYFSLGYGVNRTCVERCPRDTYELFKRCVSELECLTMPAPVDTAGESLQRTPKIFNGTCIFTCPSGYMEKSVSGHSTCELCPRGGCVKNCNGNKIDAIASAEQFKGCTHIKGNLEISLRTSGVIIKMQVNQKTFLLNLTYRSNTMAELEASLGSVREIDGSLRVIRSHPLVSLSFFKSLRRIGGQDSNGTKKQTLYIFNNPNLELLWNWTNYGPIEITQGKLFIHFNPKLCYGLIAPLQNMTKDPESKFDELEVSKENNGDQASCFQETLHLIVHKLHRQFVILKWNMYCLEDFRKLLGYSIYYIVAEHNITQYERRDACYDSWSVLDKTIDEVSNASHVTAPSKTALVEDTCNKLQPLFSPVTQLRAFTRYAAYVKTYTTVQDKRGAQSPIIYFKTLPGKPSPPQNLQADAKDAHTVQIRWLPPSEPNGILGSYRVEIQANMYNHRNILQNNYCVSQVVFRNILSNLMGETLDKKKLPPPTTTEECACREPGTAARTRFTSEAESEQAESIDFENALQNEVYHKAKRPGSRGGRSKRSHDNWLVITSNITDPVLGVSFPNETDADNYVKTVFIELNHNQLNLTLTNLRHFTSYTVAVWACRVKHENETREEYNETWCSDRAKQNFLTSELESADVVSNLRATILASNKTLNEVNVTWDPPPNPNGLVVAYTVQHLHVEDSSQTYSSSTCIAVEDFESRTVSYVLRKLAPGNYSIKVAPVSISGPSNVYVETFVNIPERKSPSGYEWVWGVIGGCLLMTLILGGGVWFARRNLLPSTEANKLFASVNPEYVSTVYVPDEWEVPRSSVELVKELGQGSFGMVYEGIAKDLVKGEPETRCAVKTVNEHATDRERIEFLNEASVMKAFDTFHVVRLLGVVSRGQPTLVVMELMALGDLKSYLRSHRPDAEQSRGAEPPTPPSLQQIYQMAIEIADGMAYLSAKKFVHRDLAARNCMVAGDLTVKVGDFGMTRDIYETDYYRKGSKGLLPVRWMSPESLKDGVFSSNSDVWSYGVVLWEMATLAMQPYQGLSNEQVLRYVVEGGVMERPEHCPDRLYELMRACWAHRPNARPPFLRLVAELAPTAAPYFRHRSFFHTQQGQEIYAQQGIPIEEESELTDLNVGAVATGSGSNLFGVSGRLASWVRELSSLRSRNSGDAAAEPLAPAGGATSLGPRKGSAPGPNGVLRDSTTRC